MDNHRQNDAAWLNAAEWAALDPWAADDADTTPNTATGEGEASDALLAEFGM